MFEKAVKYHVGAKLDNVVILERKKVRRTRKSGYNYSDYRLLLECVCGQKFYKHVGVISQKKIKECTDCTNRRTIEKKGKRLISIYDNHALLGK